MRALRFTGLALATLLLLGGWASGEAKAEPRVALVIGNSSYGGDLGELPNPANDARLMAKTLKGIGFQVIEAEDADQARMKRAIQEFGARLAESGGGATGLFFYAGHGLQVGGTNYLIPVHARIEREGDADLEAIAVDLVMKQMAFADAAVNIVILDACRNNPLSRSLRAVTRGLADPSTRPMGSFIAYSTAPGDVAEDGQGNNSPYTTALATAITRPGASINDVFQEVRGKVLSATNKKQVPWDASSLTAPFYFVPAAAAAPTAPAVSNAVDPKAIDLAFWNAIKDSKSAEDYQAYLTRFPDGVFAPLAQSRLKQADQTATRVVPQSADAVAPPAGSGEPEALQFENAFWDSVRGSETAEDYQAYLKKYPNGLYADQARQRLQDSGKEQQAAVAPTSPKPLPEIVAVNAKLYAKDRARLRAAPAADAAIVTRLAADTPLEATGRSADNAWWRVKLADGQLGYVAASAVTDQPPRPPSLAPEAQPQTSTAKAPPPTTAPAAPVGDDKQVCGATDGTPATVRAAACQRRLAAGIADDTERYNTLMDLGRAFHDQERYADALKNYQAAADIDPNYFGAFFMIGRVELDQGEIETARAAFDKAVSRDPKQADPLFYRGASARRLGDLDAARADIVRALQMNPDQPDYAEEEGLLLLSKGDVKAAVAVADHAALLEPDGFMIASTFAYTLGGRYDDALAMADRALKSDGDWAYWWIWKAMIQRGKGDPTGAQATLTEAQRRFGDWPRPVIDFLAGKIDAAALRRAGKTGTQREQEQRRCEIAFYIGAQAAAAGDKTQARAAFQQALETRIYEYIEYMVAPAFLATLEPG
jgi:uncharacterized caspase-like protein/lipoprotein NlpI